MPKYKFGFYSNWAWHWIAIFIVRVADLLALQPTLISPAVAPDNSAWWMRDTPAKAKQCAFHVSLGFLTSYVHTERNAYVKIKPRCSVFWVLCRVQFVAGQSRSASRTASNIQRAKWLLVCLSSVLNFEEAIHYKIHYTIYERNYVSIIFHANRCKPSRFSTHIQHSQIFLHTKLLIYRLSQQTRQITI